MRKVVEEIKLYAKDNNDNIREWSVTGYIDETRHGDVGILKMKYGVIGGSKTLQEEDVEEGKQSRTLIEQIQSRINSRINKKQQEGYVYDKMEAMSNKRVNKLGFLPPMLAKPYKSVIKRLNYSDVIYLQRKYNGFRCLIHNNSGDLVAYTKKGNVIENIDHILDELKGVIPEGHTFDGELYHHGTKFQTISSWVKRKQPDTKKIKYIVYDCILDKNFGQRFSYLSKIIPQYMKTVELAETDRISLPESLAKEKINEFLNLAIKTGYEGAILRTLESDKYESSKRSFSLIKLKKFQDGEFRIVKILPSKEDWAILYCVTDSGVEFKVSAPGSMDEKRQILHNKDLYIGKFVNVEYAEETLRGAPFHGVATYIRSDTID